MPRRQRCVLPGVPHHVTQRGVNRSPVFDADFDRATYLSLLRQNLAEADGGLLGWCLMTNQVHLIALPEAPESLALLLRRVHGRYAQYFNSRTGRTSHLWQSRYFACALGSSHVWSALAYVDRNPVRAGLVAEAANSVWSSASDHLSSFDATGLLHAQWWAISGISRNGRDWLVRSEDCGELEKCTDSGKPFGDPGFATEVAARFGRRWQPGRPKKKVAAPATALRAAAQGTLFSD